MAITNNDPVKANRPGQPAVNQIALLKFGDSSYPDRGVWSAPGPAQLQPSASAKASTGARAGWTEQGIGKSGGWTLRLGDVRRDHRGEELCRDSVS
ncbi:hypothetical protein KUCAC02_002321 [Chaenocephalus aceratus]|uniref:Uncharacterized protein n=1 Tax=Chaenocephalus aceratus TaxID=36190 RepID=A0ACB9XU80_CHAAC|nr:hypothetical protein KUCAC02_002321 [Chaenocephalus aceratus]